MIRMDFPGGPLVKNPLPMLGIQAQSLIQEDPICLRANMPATTEPALYRPGATITEAGVPSSPGSATGKAAATRSPFATTRAKALLRLRAVKKLIN